jgi:hypothetical protein
MDNAFLMILLAWPGVIVACGLLNMLVSWTFSWSELIFDYLVGLAIGGFFMWGTADGAGGFAKFMLVFSHGLFGLLNVADVSLFASRGALFAWSAGGLGGALIVAGLLDRVALAIGGSMSVGAAFVSVPSWLLKVPFSLVTSGVGLLFFLVGIVRALAGRNGSVGIHGGVLYVEWSNASGSAFATTVGSTVQVWKGRLSRLVAHELYHSRQYQYLRDWLIPAWLLGGLWGLISGAVAGRPSIRYFSTADALHEVGNPLERAAYRL